jgi:2',3'-cyclic-nucleotide 2'-phosphodiesterase (5'-nucleotidase family)
MKKHILKKMIPFLLVALYLLTATPVAFAAGEAGGDVVILYVNDVHCGVDAGTPEGSMGYANLAALKKELAQTHSYVTLVDAGDAIQGDAIGTLSDGAYLVDIMNYVGFEYAVFGNHEFDYGMDVTLSLLENADAEYLACNFEDLRTGELVAKPYSLETYGDLTVAYVGIATPESFTKSTPTYFQDENGNYIYGFREGGNGQELYDTVQSAVDAARAEGADLVIALGHLGTDTAR